MGWRPKGGVHDPVFCSALTVPSASTCQLLFPDVLLLSPPSALPLNLRASPSPTGHQDPFLFPPQAPLALPPPIWATVCAGRSATLGLAAPPRTPPWPPPPASQTLASLPSIPPLGGPSLGSAPSPGIQKVSNLPKGRCLDANLTTDLSLAPPPPTPPLQLSPGRAHY